MLSAGKAADARKFDNEAIQRGIPSLILMENAAFSLYLEISEVIKKFNPDKIVVFAGKGGNGGDGFALLRILKDRGCNIPMYIVPFFDVKKEFKEDVNINPTCQNWNMIPKSVEITDMENISGKVLFIDAMVGTGLKNRIAGKIKEGVEFINNYKNKFVVAVDIPTGLDSDSGFELDSAVISDMTVTMGIYKTGLFLEKGPSVAGQIILGKISAIDDSKEHFSYFVQENLIPKSVNIAVDSFKNKNGHLLIIGGDIDKLGATIIAAKSFMASGGGLVTSAFKKNLHKKIAGLMPGMMLADIDSFEENINKYDSLIIGPGLSSYPFKNRYMFEEYNGIVIADAGMFEIMKNNKEIFDSLKNCKTVFTPHPGELKMFLKEKKLKNWIDCVEEFPLQKTHLLIAKNHSTFIKHADKTIIIPHGAKALSFAGSGDSLTGIAAFETYFNGFFEGAVRSVLRHRLAGIMLEEKFAASFHDIDKLTEMIGKTGRSHEV